jgi:hypothetical protein
VNSLFHETKSSTMDMCILILAIFLDNMKSPSSMRNGRFHPPKCRGKSKFPPCNVFFLLLAHIFLHMWSTLDWLLHMWSTLDWL